MKRQRASRRELKNEGPQAWRTATAERPCPVCGEVDRCAYVIREEARQGHFGLVPSLYVCCRRVGSYERIPGSPVAYQLHWLRKDLGDVGALIAALDTRVVDSAGLIEKVVQALRGPSSSSTLPTPGLDRGKGTETPPAGEKLPPRLGPG